jgi:hypothetical protein
MMNAHALPEHHKMVYQDAGRAVVAAVLGMPVRNIGADPALLENGLKKKMLHWRYRQQN